MGRKSAPPLLIDQFLRDLTRLHKVEKITLDVIGKRTGIPPSSLSHFLAKGKKPGQETINKFYMELKDEIKEESKNPPYESPGPSPEVEEAALRFLPNAQDDLVTLLKDNDRFLKNEMRVINRTHEKNAEAFQKLADTNSKMYNKLSAGPSPAQ